MKVKENTMRPSYYGGKDNQYEAIKYIQAHQLSFELGNVIKYVTRAGKKQHEAELKDLNKALEYLQFEIEKAKAKRGVLDGVNEKRKDEPEGDPNVFFAGLVPPLNELRAQQNNRMLNGTGTICKGVGQYATEQEAETVI